MRIGFLIVIVVLLTGCVQATEDPGGMTTRAQIEADAQRDMAQAEAHASGYAAEQDRIAREAEAVQQRMAAEAEAQAAAYGAEQDRVAREAEALQQRMAAEAAAVASVQVAEQEAYAKVKVNEYWSTALIWILIIIALGGIYALYLNWRGRLAMAVITRPALPSMDPTGGEPMLTVREFKLLGGTKFDIVRHSDSGQWYGMRNEQMHRLVDFSPERGL